MGSSPQPTARASSRSTSCSMTNWLKYKLSQLVKTRSVQWLSTLREHGFVWDSKHSVRSSYGNGNLKVISSTKKASFTRPKPFISISTNSLPPVQTTARSNCGIKRVDFAWLLFRNTSHKSPMSSSPIETHCFPAVWMVVSMLMMWSSTRNSENSNLTNSASWHVWKSTSLRISSLQDPLILMKCSPGAYRLEIFYKLFVAIQPQFHA